MPNNGKHLQLVRNHPEQRSTAGNLAPEIVLMILNYVRHPRDALPDPPHVLPTLRAIPLVCRAWYHPGMEVLYQRVIFTSRSSQRAKLLCRSIDSNRHLGELINVLCFPDLRFRPCDYYRNSRSTIRLQNYANLVAKCPNVLFLTLPTNLQNALSPLPLPGLPLVTNQIENVISLYLTAHPGSARYSSDAQLRTCAPLSFLPIHTSLPYLVHLTLENFTFSLEGFPQNSRLLFPYLPSLRSLTLTSCLLDDRAATQIFSSLRGTLKYLELWQSGYLPDLTEAAFRILGPTLEGLVIDEYLYEYHVMVDTLCMLPVLRTLKLAAEKLSVDELRRLPPSLEKLKITALPTCACSRCAKGHSDTERDSPGDMGMALAHALGHAEFDARNLKVVVLAGRCCAWHKWVEVIEERCKSRNIQLVREVLPGECHDMRSLARRRVDAVKAWPKRKVSTFLSSVSDRLAW